MLRGPAMMSECAEVAEVSRAVNEAIQVVELDFAGSLHIDV